MVDNTNSPTFWAVENDGSHVILSSHFFQNVCRLCANICNDVVPIFDQSEGKTSIFALLKKCLPWISISENDMKPKHVCLPCISKLKSCVSFVDMLSEADSKFELLLQNKGTSPHNEISLVPMKQENGTVVKYESSGSEHQVDIPNVELLNQFYQPRTFSQQIVSTPVSLSSIQNQSLNLIQDGANHSILQNLLTQNTVSSQNVLVVVELKSKDMVAASNNQVVNKKIDSPQNMLLPAVKITPPAPVTTNHVPNKQMKIVDTNGHTHVINVSDFEGKFNHYDKIVSSIITDNAVSEEDIKSKSLSSSSSTASFLETFDSDVLNINNLLKFDSSGSDTSLTSSIDPTKIVLKSSSATSITSSTSTSVNRSKQDSLFPCEMCGKGFTRKSRLNAHVARHSSERTHVCEKCDQRFITKWDLTLHLRIHSGVFSCEFCNKAFPAKGKLDRHRRTHTGERPFRCDYCDRAFSEKRNLNNHLKIHQSTTVAIDNSKNLNASDTTCSCWFLSAENQNLIKNTCDMCRRRNNSNGTGASDVVEMKSV